MALNSIQQNILSYFNLAKVSSLDSVLKFYKEVRSVCSVDPATNEGDLRKEISDINLFIKKCDLEIVECIDEASCNILFVFINTVDDCIAKKSRFYEKNTTQLFSKILKECILSEEGHISEIQSLNLNVHIGISKTSAQAILVRLLKDKWLTSKNGMISLGMRSIIELEQNLKKLYPNEIKHCPFCKLIVIQGFLCSNCKVKCHFACLKKYSTHAQSKCSCPKCNIIWNSLPIQSNIIGSEETESDTGNQTLVSASIRKRKHFEVKK